MLVTTFDCSFIGLGTGKSNQENMAQLPLFLPTMILSAPLQQNRASFLSNSSTATSEIQFNKDSQDRGERINTMYIKFPQLIIRNPQQHTIIYILGKIHIHTFH